MIDVEWLDARTNRFHVRGWVHPVSGLHVAAAGARLRAFGLRPIYRCQTRDAEWWAPRSMAWLGVVLRWRDATVRSWGRHCFDLGLLREGNIIPLLPKWDWFRFGWY